jgi:GntR family transcriptional repressor for pyruvate dehydrogenase complex
MRVRRLDVAELKNLAEVRVLLEPRALETALDTGVHPNAGEARRSMDAAERALGRDDQTLVTQANRAFHRLLYSGTPNAYLCGLLDELQDLLAFYGLAGWGQMPPSQIELQEHEEILKLVEAREGEQAAHAMMLHISRSTDRLLEAFPSETRLIEGDVPQVL